MFLQFHASLFGYMANRFRKNLKDPIKDQPASVVKTVKRLVATMINLFFEESHDKVKNACALSFCEILDYCFDNKACKGGHKAAPLLTDPLFECLRSAINHQQRQFAANILRKMCLHYQGDTQVLDGKLVKEIVTTGISKKIYDSDFLLTISELIQMYGITEVLGVNSAQALPYFVGSLNFNITGGNAIGKV